jgi:mannose-1-phosphate guanylyltransferase
MSNFENNYVIIMAGGIGSRFWPFSRTNHPKQFHDVLGVGKTMIQKTVERYKDVCPQQNIYVVTNKIYYDLVKQQLPHLSDEQILLEPTARNTAPCVAYACFKIAVKNPNANIVVSPADHVILKEEEFVRTIKMALSETERTENLLTLGIQPHRPDTGYGYIQFIPDGRIAKKVKTFTEKPNLELAQKFLESGDYVWNAGIFIWHINAIKKAFATYLPEMADLFREGERYYYTPQEAVFINEIYPQCKSISIDYGIMEKATNVYTILSEFGWSDLGTWKSLYEIAEKDQNQNVIDGKVMLYDSNNCIIKTSHDKLVVVQGLSGYIVAESDGVIMICRKEEEQRVKDFVADAKATQDKKFV